MPATDDLHQRLTVVDGLQYSAWTRERFEEWREGGLDCVHVTCAVWETAREAIDETGRWTRRFEEFGDLIVHAKGVADIEAARGDGKTAVLLGFQNTSPLEDSLDLLSMFHALGVRIVQLTYNTQNSVGSGCWEERDTGVSGYVGRSMIREMNELGILVDISHCGDQTCLDAIELSSAPVAITHGNPRSVVGDDVELAPRNRSDTVLRELAAADGLIGLSMYPRITLGGENSTVGDFCEMVMRTAEIVGIERVGIGSDFCLGHPIERFAHWRTGRWSREPAIKIRSATGFPSWIPTPAQFGALTEGLVETGLSEHEIRGVMGENYLNLFRRVFGDDD